MSDVTIDLTALQADLDAVKAEAADLESTIAAAIKALRAEQAMAVAELEETYAEQRAAFVEQQDAITSEMLKHPAVQAAASAQLAERSARRQRSRKTSTRDVLEYIVENEPCGYSDIAVHYDVTVQTVRGRVDQLVEQKLVIKKENPANRRAILLESVEGALDQLVDDEE